MGVMLFMHQITLRKWLSEGAGNVWYWFKSKNLSHTLNSRILALDKYELIQLL